jgi:hypothetical protein
MPTHVLEEGNLAALEEDPSTAPRGGNPSTMRPAPMGSGRTASGAPLRKGSRSAVAFMVVLFVLAVTVGAYYTGLLPGAAPH